MDAQRRNLSALIKLPEVSEAFYLASPVLYRDIPLWQTDPDSERGQEVEWALAKYMARMASWPKPVGLFSGITVGELCSSRRQGHFLISPPCCHERHTRIDGNLWCRLAARLARLPGVQQRLLFRPNTSLAFVQGSYRYIATWDEAGDGRASELHLISVAPSQYLESTLERAWPGARVESLARALVADHSVTYEEAASYVEELVETLILMPDLGVLITGPQPIDGLIQRLVTAGLDSLAAPLRRIRERLRAIDAQGVGALPSTYEPIIKEFEDILDAASTCDREVHRRRLHDARVFHVDTVVATPTRPTIASDVAHEVRQVIALLSRASPCRDNEALLEFKRDFYSRWGDREVPLTEVLDQVVGIGYGCKEPAGSRLLQGPFGPFSRDCENRLLSMRQQAMKHRASEIVLSASDFDPTGGHRQGEEAVRLPDALSATIRLANRGGETEIWLRRVGGPSGVRLHARFCDVSETIEKTVRTHIAREAALRPDVIFAEIVHLANGRSADILRRPVLRDHEIVYLGLGSTPANWQIRIDDLFVSVKERIILRSQRLGCEIVPRLTCAHKVAGTDLPVYRFLLALQNQGYDFVAWSWGRLADSPWLPRVRVGRVLLAREQWRLQEEDIRHLAQSWSEKGTARRARTFAAVQALRARRRLPRYVALINGESEEFVDLDHQLLVHAFVGEVIIRGARQLVEVFPDPNSTIVKGPKGGHSCEMVLAFIRDLAAEGHSETLIVD